MSTRSATLMTVMVAMLVSHAATAQDTSLTVVLSGGSRVRGVDRQARSLLETAIAMSPTVARMVGSLQTSDVIVNVELWPLSPKMRGEFRVVTAMPTVRYARIRIRVPNSRDEMISVLGHELQHALEVAAASEITNTATQRKYYQRFGWATMAGGYFETKASLDAGRQVAADLVASKRGHTTK